MILQILDLETKDAVVSITTAAEVERWLEGLRERDPFMFELAGDNGYQLTIGLGKGIGCVQFSKSDGDPPYLVAKSETLLVTEPQEFSMGGTPTPINPEFCLSFDRVKDIAIYFATTGEKHPAISWDEV
jgi:hypothetical protein